MLRDFALVVQKDLLLDSSRILEKSLLEKGCNRLGHAADVVVLAKQRHELGGEGVYELTVIGAKELDEIVVVGCGKEFPKTQRMKIKCSDWR